MKGTIFVIIGVFVLSLFITFYGSQFFDSQDVRNEEIVNYLNIPFYEPDLDFLSENEKSHMHDVKILFNMSFVLLLLCTFSLFFIKLEFKDFKITGIYILTFEFISLVLLLIGGFTWFWNLFHKIFFPQGNYSFSLDSTLITLYPENYFLGFVIIVYIFLTIFAVSFLFSDKIYKFIIKKTN